MANHPSSLKRARQDTKRHARNTARRSEIKTLVKKALTAPKESAGAIVRTLQSKLDRATDRSTLHWKTAARKLSRIAKAVAARS